MPKRLKCKSLSNCLALIKLARENKDWAKVKRHGEIALENISSFTYSPYELYSLYCYLGHVYYIQGSYSRSIDLSYKAYLTALKHSLPPADLAYTSVILSNSFLALRSTKHALSQLQKVEQYFQKYGTKTPPMDEVMNLVTLLNLAHCYLYADDLNKVREIIEDKIAPYRDILWREKKSLVYYQHIKGEYLMLKKQYTQSRNAMQEGLNICKELGHSGEAVEMILETKLHLVKVDLLETKYDDAITVLQLVLKDARKMKSNEIICAASLLLSKCYLLKNSPDKANKIEIGIRPVLRKIDTVWLYEETKELDSFFRRLADSPSPYHENISVNFTRRYETLNYKSIIIGKSKLLQEVFTLLEKIAPTDLPVLIQGETGTGKELIANSIHQNSFRANKPYLPFNSDAIPETLVESTLFGHTKGAFTGAIEEKKGYIELADGGTLFIDEISNMSSSMQQKLLRVLEEKILWRLGAQKPTPVDTRFIFASNQDVEQMVNNKFFREDLFYRINTIVINLPPLRDRKDDIPALVQHFLKKHYNLKSMASGFPEISPDTLRLLAAYPWPGNIRELENEIKRILTLYKDVKLIDVAMLSNVIRDYRSTNMRNRLCNQAGKLTMREMEKEFIRENLDLFKGNISQSARQLGYTYCGLLKKLKQLGLYPITYKRSL
ncbi:MAG: sigma-54-dependent Fis family transcriptional regulator [Planctomycetes bacterium]|nr:sigma-54-dependent Fis family transcriptional regulator [Planctomycetota bacterium]